MRVFRCDVCGQHVFFENTLCLHCGQRLAYVPDLSRVAAMRDVGENLLQPASGTHVKTYRLCANYRLEGICNWALESTDDSELCRSCRLTRVIPDLSVTGNRQAWYRLETAKRRVLYSLMNLRLSVLGQRVEPQNGLVFEFVGRPDSFDANPVVTGHQGGVITIDIAEADDAERERRRIALHEAYRTVLGHVRHETGHFFWFPLIEDNQRLDSFRELFGDESADYSGALRTYYDRGPVADWQFDHVSAYASAHPWEDWAESWAHYLHMADTVETAQTCGLSFQPGVAPSPPASFLEPAQTASDQAFNATLAQWFGVSYGLNNLNRSLGLADAYPFALSLPAVRKLRFVHEAIGAGALRCVSHEPVS